MSARTPMYCITPHPENYIETRLWSIHSIIYPWNIRYNYKEERKKKNTVKIKNIRYNYKEEGKKKNTVKIRNIWYNNKEKRKKKEKLFTRIKVKKHVIWIIYILADITEHDLYIFYFLRSHYIYIIYHYLHRFIIFL